MNLKGRENEFRNIAIELLKRFQSDIGEVLIEYRQAKFLTYLIIMGATRLMP